MKIRTAIFTVYVAASAVAFAILIALVLREQRLRYIESMRRTVGDTAAFLAVFAADGAVPGDDTWAQKLAALPPKVDLLRVFASDRAGRILFDSAQGRDVGQTYDWPMRGGGRAASENYSVDNVEVVGDELRVRTPVRVKGELIGWVGVGRHLASVSEGLSQARGQLLKYSSALAVIMVFAGWWIASRLTHSLEKLTVYALEVSEGKNVAPPASRAIEIAALGRAFEQMRVTLEGKAHVERYTQALAHELKAPLSAIRGAAELLSEEMPREDRVKFLANLRSESERLHLIVERMLELAALEARRTGATHADVALREVVAESTRQAASVAAAKKITLDFRDGARLGVRGDKFLLGQAVSNLVQNALEFTPVGGTVTLTLAEQAQRVRVVVEDTGPGVPDYALPRIGERFYSLPRPDTGRKSTGLGLSIVREIARLHGGEFTLVNRSGGGARAELSLPIG